jgi:CheY-like chemotaxis protein
VTPPLQRARLTIASEAVPLVLDRRRQRAEPAARRATCFARPGSGRSRRRPRRGAARSRSASCRTSCSCDLGLPDLHGTAGRARAKRRNARRDPVVALTSQPLEGGDWHVAAGFSGYLEKPFDVGTVPRPRARLLRTGAADALSPRAGVPHPRRRESRGGRVGRAGSGRRMFRREPTNRRRGHVGGFCQGRVPRARRPFATRGSSRPRSPSSSLPASGGVLGLGTTGERHRRPVKRVGPDARRHRPRPAVPRPG